MFSISKILLPIDFSERSADAAEAAATVAEQFDAEITVLHVLAPHIEPIAVSGQRSVIHSFAREEAEAKMSEFRCSEWHHLAVKRVLQEGDPAREIVDYAESEKIDLIMMPTHGYGPFRRLLLGSVTAKVLHDANCPVWTAVHREKDSPHIPAKPRSIAVAVDLEPHSQNVLSWASRLSWKFDAPLSVIHVAPLDPGTVEYYVSPEWRSEVIGSARTQLAEILETDGIKAEIYIEVGDAPKAVMERARVIGAELIIIGRSAHGRDGRLPTTAYAIIRDAPCPVLSV